MNDLRADLAALRIDRSGPKPPNKLLRALLALALVSGLGLAGARWGRPLVQDHLLQVEVAATEISALSPSQAAVDLTSTGYVVPQVTAKVSSNVIGRVTSSTVREGQAVKKGDVLFELDPTDQKATVAAARARVAAAAARVATFRAQRAELTLEIARQKKLVESGAAAKAPLDDLEAKAASVDAQIHAAEAEVSASAAETTAAEVQLKHLTIAAPIPGTVMTKPAALGDVTNPGVPLVELADFASMLVEADVSEGRLGVIKAGGPCEIVLDALPSLRLRGEVVEIGPRLNRAKATATVKVRFAAPPPELRPEMSARVSFLSKPLDEAQLKETEKHIVPAAAVIERAGGKAVFVLESGKVRLVPVKVGEALGSGYVLLEGPAPGTRVVKDPPAALGDGQTVKEKTT